MTDEQKAQQSASHMGHHASEETKAKIAAAGMGRIMSPEACAKLSARMEGNTYWLGRHHSEEEKAKISASEKGKLGHPPSLETSAKLSAALRGLPSHNWKGGPTPEKRKKSAVKHAAKRRTLGFVPLNESFLGCEGHHVDNEQVIYMPKELHRSIPHRQRDGRGMAQMNAVAYNYLFKQEVEAAMAKVTP